VTKKGYQKRLPKVLPDAGPRPVAPAPRVPAPRASTDASAPLADPAETAEPTETDERVEPAEPIEPVETDEPAGTVELDERRLRSSSERHRSSIGWLVAMVLACLVLSGVAGFLLVTALRDDDPARPAGGPVPTSPARSGTSQVVSEVRASGDVVVHQRIRTTRPIQLLRLELPLAPVGEGMTARQVEIVADGVAVVGPATITDEFATYTFSPATDVRVRYRLTGAVELSESAPGRALAVVTSLNVRYVPRVERETRVVRASEVLLLACSQSTDEPPVPCGERDGDGGWRVDLTGERVDDRVVAQLTLG
jgi:hypothetical protein